MLRGYEEHLTVRLREYFISGSCERCQAMYMEVNVSKVAAGGARHGLAMHLVGAKGVGLWSMELAMKGVALALPWHLPTWLYIHDRHPCTPAIMCHGITARAHSWLMHVMLMHPLCRPTP